MDMTAGEIIDKANYIVQQEMVFKMRKRMNMHHSEKDKQYEQDLHDTRQKIAWDEVKEYIVNNKNDIIEYRRNTSDRHRNIIDSILSTIDNEINEILLKD